MHKYSRKQILVLKSLNGIEYFVLSKRLKHYSNVKIFIYQLVCLNLADNSPLRRVATAQKYDAFEQ